MREFNKLYVAAAKNERLQPGNFGLVLIEPSRSVGVLSIDNLSQLVPVYFLAIREKAFRFGHDCKTCETSYNPKSFKYLLMQEDADQSKATAAYGPEALVAIYNRGFATFHLFSKTMKAHLETAFRESVRKYRIMESLNVTVGGSYDAWIASFRAGRSFDLPEGIDKAVDDFLNVEDVA